ncbi:MAG: hypothetical protein HC794_01150 [Nitrospiraceae bacterium]|nr:hypothetical protein [Nitrospiraceae bacterium]
MEILEQMMRSGRCHLSLGRYSGEEWNALCVMEGYPSHYFATQVTHKNGDYTWTTWKYPDIPLRFYLCSGWDYEAQTSEIRFPLRNIRKRDSVMFGNCAVSYDIWFKGPDGYLWYGRGDNRVNCKRLVKQYAPPHIWNVPPWGKRDCDSARYKQRSVA